MAGDHKCPVCNSTFTRPQHVARHMRSHTGDRPYKCTTCGDQFARSDLLSRHVNKCHASEQPPTTKARRRGTAAGARALSSKQACDQCVTNSLPCDGAKPCSKCRGKDRCTYVQFHRQTAPSGPGHPMPPPTHSDILARAPISIQGAPDDFLLAPIVPQAATTMDIPSMYAHPHYIPPSSDIYHDYPHLPSLANAQANSLNALIQRDALDNQDAIARYHAHSDLFARAGVIQNAALSLAQPAPTADNTTSLPALYAAAQDPQYDRYTMSQPPSSHQSWEATPSYHQSKSVMDAPSYAPHSHPPSSVSSAGSSHPPSVGPPPSIEAGGPPSQPQYPHAPLPSLYQEQQQQQQVPRHHPYHHHSRSDDLSSSEAGDLASDAGSTGTGPSHSIPSSANSSAIHLPLPGVNSLRSKGPTSAKDDFEDRYPNVPSQDGNEHETESGFSSVFGMMSLDDPNVIAGISNDGQPFFSSLPGFPNNNSSSPAPLSLVTPTQDLLTQLKSAGGREGIDSKEMRDFWKMYLRTPLTGTNASGNGVMFPLQTPTGPGVPLGHNNSAQGSGAGRPSPSRRHSRVASLPSIKTPPLFAEDRGQFAQRPSTGDHSDQEAGVAGGYNSNVRTTLHDSEDLKSYEQAVLARKPSMHLNLVPKRKGSHTSSRTQNPPIGKSKSTSPVVPHAFSSGPKTTSPVAPHAFLSGPASFPLSSGSSNIAELLNRPSSSSSTDTSSSISHPSNTANTTASSSLAHVFGGQQPPRSEGQPTRSPPPDTHGAYTTDSCRPSFKRIASQTLAPDNAKRASLGPAGWDVNRYDEEDEEEEDACLNTSPRISGTALYETTSQPSLAVPAQS